MNYEAKKSKYPYPKSRIYLSVIITVWSLILTLQLLQTPALILRYFASTFIIATITFIIKRHYFYTKITVTHQRVANENLKNRTPWKLLILLFSVMIAILVFPLFLASYLDPYTWFILIVSLTSGISIGEILLYVYMR